MPIRRQEVPAMLETLERMAGDSDPAVRAAVRRVRASFDADTVPSKDDLAAALLAALSLLPATTESRPADRQRPISDEPSRRQRPAQRPPVSTRPPARTGFSAQIDAQDDGRPRNEEPPPRTTLLGRLVAAAGSATVRRTPRGFVISPKKGG